MCLSIRKTTLEKAIAPPSRTIYVYKVYRTFNFGKNEYSSPYRDHIVKLTSGNVIKSDRRSVKLNKDEHFHGVQKGLHAFCRKSAAIFAAEGGCGCKIVARFKADPKDFVARGHFIFEKSVVYKKLTFDKIVYK